MALISFVFSFYNEQDCLDVLIKQLRQVMVREGDDYELIFVNDASTDDSVAVLSKNILPIAKEKIILITMSRRFGVEECFLAGLKHAKGNAIIFMYADLQDSVATVHDLLLHWRQGSEVVHTVRSQRIGEHPIKNIVAALAYRFINKISDVCIPDDAGDFKLISNKVGQYLLNFPEKDPYLRGLIPWIGFKQTFVTYKMQPRTLGCSKIPLFGKKAWTVFCSGVTSFSSFPIPQILITGLVSMGLAFVLLLILLVQSFYVAIDRIVFLTIFIFFLWSLLMVSVGFIGLYVVRMYKDVRGRPAYIIGEIKELT